MGMEPPKPKLLTEASLPSEGSSSINMVKLEKRRGVFRIPVTDKWAIGGTTQVKIRSTRTTLCVLGLLCTLVATGVVLNFRIHKLEAKNMAMEETLDKLGLKLGCFMAKLGNPGPASNPRLEFGHRSSGSGVDIVAKDCMEFEEQLALLSRNDGSNHGPRIRKSVDYRGQNRDGDEVEPFKNASAPFPGPEPSRSSKSLPNPSHRKRERGNRKEKSEQNSSLSKGPLHLHLTRLQALREKDQRALAKLKIKLETAKERAKAAKSLLSAYRKQELFDNSNRFKSAEARAAYLTVRDTAINILNPKQHIGPWHLTADGADLGFNDLWYQNLSLDDNGTSVIFQEGGLYLIYAQVYYKSTQTKKDKAASLGFKIYLQKAPKLREVFQRPIPISECVPAYPSYYQTCFTQICWYIEAGDEIYLEHFTEAKPVIEAENPGQTFLGIVRLSH